MKIAVKELETLIENNRQRQARETQLVIENQELIRRNAEFQRQVRELERKLFEL